MIEIDREFFAYWTPTSRNPQSYHISIIVEDFRLLTNDFQRLIGCNIIPNLETCLTDLLDQEGFFAIHTLQFHACWLLPAHRRIGDMGWLLVVSRR